MLSRTLKIFFGFILAFIGLGLIFVGIFALGGSVGVGVGYIVGGLFLISLAIALRGR